MPPSLSVILILGIQFILSAICAEPVHKFVTYNTVLQYRFPNKEARLAALPAQLEQLDSDVICLQEVFLLEDIVKIEDNLRHKYPYTFSSIDSEKTALSTGTPCQGTASTLWKMLCVAVRCEFNGPPAQAVECAVQKCSFTEISQECITCLGAAMPSIRQLVSKCVLPSAGPVNVPGLMVLSKKPLYDSVTLDFLPGRKQVFSKAVIITNVEKIGFVACTHLTPEIQNQPYFEPESKDLFSSFAAENSFEADYILNLIKHSPKVIIMGDFNSGPAVPFFNIVAAFPETYYKMIAAGLESPYVKLVGKQTFIDINSIYDHVLHKGFTTISARRLNLLYGNGYPLSDHYGVEVWLK